MLESPPLQPRKQTCRHMKPNPSVLILSALILAQQPAWAANNEAYGTTADYVPIVKDPIRPEDVAAENAKLPLKYPVEINVNNDEIKSLLEEHLPLITQQQEETLDEEQMNFLSVDAPTQIQTMLRTKGYFNSSSNIRKNGNTYQVNVTTGPRTTVNNVEVAIIGDILQDDQLAEYYKNAIAGWQLPIHDPFGQDGWSSSKTAVLSAVTRKKYPLAKLTASQATIDPTQNSADLSVTVESFQPIYFGDINVSGTKRYPEKVVLGLAHFNTGSPYDLDKLLDYQQALEQNSHYSGATVEADFNSMQNNHVPINVTVEEVKRQKLELGVRYDSEYGPGIRAAYDHYNVFNRGYIASSVFDFDDYETTVGFGLSQPRNNNGHFWSSNVAFTRSTTQNLETKASSAGLWYVRDRNNIESRLGLEFYNESLRIPDGNIDLGKSHATMVTASWKHQNIETLLHPQNGYYLDAKVGSTLGKLLSSTSMQRIHTRAGYYFTPENPKIGTFIARGQVGYVKVGDQDMAPSTLMFRTGGATSVRGYELDSIGLEGPNNSVLPERALAVASFEYQYPFTRSIAGAVFHDMGDAAKNFSRLSMKHGTGIGVRWFSPVAPFSFDIAYGHSDKKIRWHISLGTRF